MDTKEKMAYLWYLLVAWKTRKIDGRFALIEIKLGQSEIVKGEDIEVYKDN